MSTLPAGLLLTARAGLHLLLVAVLVAVALAGYGASRGSRRRTPGHGDD